MLKNIEYSLIRNKSPKKKITKDLKKIIETSNESSEILRSLSKKYNYNFSLKKIKKFKDNKNFRIFGMGGSILGAKAIYDFLKHKIRKNFYFIDSIYPNKNWSFNNKNVNLIISKSGNTLETIVNSNLYLLKNDKNLIITENKKSPLGKIAEDLKCEVIEHNNFIGGRYSVLSEVGMLPAIFMGLDQKKFKMFNELIKNKKFLKNLISNVSSIINLSRRKFFNSIILNYDEKSDSLLRWYQQLIGESLGKKSKGILPIVSPMPMDNHTLMQYYLDGPKKSFFTFFSVDEKKSKKINKSKLPKSHYKLTNYTSNEILYAQKNATEKIFRKKNIPFRSFNILKRNESTMGELFCFFILETILLGRAMKVNPFDQPSVELIKKETKKILI